MTFDSDQYFSKRQRLANKTSLEGLAIQRENKLARLEAGEVKDRMETLHAKEQAADSFTSQLGLDANSLPGRVANIAANIYSGTSRAAGDIAVIAPTAATIANEAGLSESDFQAYNRYVTGKATPEDMTLLNSATSVSDVKGITNATRLELFNQAGEARRSAINVDESFDRSDAVDQRFKNALQKSLGDDFESAWDTTKEGWAKLGNGNIQKGVDDLLTGTGKLVNKAVEAAITNPQGSLEYVAENIPQLAIGAVRKGGAQALLASNAGYASDYYQKGIVKYQAENGGAYPSEAMREQMAQDATLAGAMEQISDKAMLGAGKLAKAAKVGENTGRVGKTLGAGAAGVVNESITEGVQTYLEGEASLSPASAKDIYTGAAIGGITGGAMTGGMRGIAETGEALSERAANKVPVQDTEAYKETFKKAVEENNPDLFLDKESPNYNPEAAVGVLLQAAKTENATSEVKTANFTKATDIVEALEQERDALISGNPEAITATETEIAKIDLLLSKIDPADTAKIEALQSMKQEFEKDLQTDLGNPEVNAPKIAALEQSLNVARRIQSELGTLANPVTPEAFQELVASVKSTEKGVASAAADRLINLSMVAPNSVDDKVLSNLVNDKANGLKPEQRAALRQFTEARKKENSLMTMGKVSAEILTGDPKKRQLGIKNYRDLIGTAIASGNQKAAERPLNLMANFVKSHTAKASLTASALLRPGVSQVVRLDNGSWEIRDPALKPLTEKQMFESGSFTVDPANPASVKTVERIGKEAKILENSFNQLSQAVKVKFSSPSANDPVVSIYVQENGQDKPRSETSSEVKVSQNQPPSPPDTKPLSKLEKGRLRNAKQEAAVKAAEESIAKRKAAKELLATSTSQPSGSSVANAPSATVVPTTNREVSKEAQAAQDVVGLTLDDVVQLSEQELENAVTKAQTEEASVGTPSTNAGEVSTGNPTQSIEAEATSEQPDGAVAESPVAEVVAYKGLNVFEQKVKELPGTMQEVFLKTNLVAQFLKQKLNSDKYKSARPLVAMGDFITAWKANEQPTEVFLKNFLEKDEVIEQEADTALKHMRDFISDLLPKFDTDLVVYDGDPNFKSRDPVQYLMDETGAIEENVKAAMAYAVYSYLLTQANNPVSLERSQVNEMHNKDAEADLTETAYGELSQYSSFEQTFIDNVGTAAVQALGFVPEPDAPINLLPNLVSAMGIRILATMEREGHIIRVARNAREVETMMDPANEAVANVMFGPEVQFNYIKLARDGKKLTGPVAMIQAMNAGIGGITDRLFGSEKAARMAGTKPSKFMQQFAKNTEQDISIAQREVIQKTMNTPHTAIPAMMQLFSLIGRENVLKAAGWVELSEEGTADKNVHEINRRSVEAQNQNLENQFDKMMEMYEMNEPDQEYFVEQFVGKNYRAYFANQSLNQQTSKIHRFAFQRPGWEVEIDLNNTEQVNEYKVAVAMSLGIKTDTQLNTKTLAEFDAWLVKNNKVSKAIEAIRAGLVEGTNVFDDAATKSLIGEAAASTEGMMSMQAMVSYAHYLQAVKRAENGGPTKFKTTLLVGVDGKTNGPMLSILALGAAPNLEGFYTLLNKGGIFSDTEGQPQHYSKFASDGGRDLYQDFGLTFLRNLYTKVISADELSALRATAIAAPKGSPAKKAAWKEYFKYVGQHEVDSLQTITGNLITEDGLNVTSAGRNLPKTPMTSFFFGSAVKKSIANMENKFIESIYSNIQDISKGSKKAPTREEFITSLNILINRGDYTAPQIPTNMTVDQMMKAGFLNGREAALRSAFQHIMAKPVQNTMESYFAVFIDRRKSLVNSVQAAYSAYAAAYTALRNTEINRLINEDKIAWRMSEGEKKPLHELSVKQERDLRLKVKNLLPVMHSDYSIRENNIDAGIYMAKSERTSTTDDMHSTKVTLGAPVADPKQKHISAQALTRKESSPGVAGSSYPIHSADSADIHYTMNEIDQTINGQEDMVTTVNVHDEASNGLDSIINVAKTMNRNVVDIFLNYSPTREAVFMLERILTNMVSGIKDGTIDKSAVREMYEQWINTYSSGMPVIEPTPGNIADMVIRETYANAHAADLMRLEGISHMTSIDQYTWEGGQYNDADGMAAFRKKAADKLANLKAEPTKEVLKMIEFLNKTYIENEVGFEGNYEGSAVDLAVNPDVDNDVLAISMALIGLPGNIAMEAVEQIKDWYPAVYSAMIEGKPLMEAIEDLNHTERADILQNLTHMAASLPLSISPWGALGESTGHNANLLTLFDGKESITLKELAPTLFQELKTAGSMSDSYYLLLKQAMRVIDNDMKIVMVRPDTKADAILDKGASNARGWYVSKNDDQAIYLLSPDFAHARINPELLLHELVHGALAQVMETELANPTNTALGQHVKNLQALLEEARSFVAENKIKGVEAALVNVHELVSWGLTNKNFQKNVLGKMTSAVETKGSGLVSKMKYFIQQIAGVLFKGMKLDANAKATNGLMVLVVNAAALYASAATNKQRSDITTNMEADPVTEMEAMTTVELYGKLTNHNGEQVDPIHDEHLRNLLNGIVKQIHGSTGTFKELMKRADLSGSEIMAEAMVTGQIPFGAEALNIGGMTEQEAFVMEQVEATVAQALLDGGAQTGIVHRELLGLYEEMRAKLKPEHFHVTNATAIEIQEAKEIYDFMFKIEADATGKSNYLSRFAAVALTHKEVRDAMNVATNMRSLIPADTDFLSRLMVWFEKALGMVSSKLTKTYPGMDANAKLGTLVQQLVDSEVKRKRTELQRMTRATPISDSMDKVSNTVRAKIVDFGQSKFFQNSNLYMKTLGQMTSVIAGDRLAMFGKTLNDIRDAEFKGRQGFFAGVLRELMGTAKDVVVFDFLHRAAKRVEGVRKDIMTGTAKLALESFANKGKDLKMSDRKALSAGVLRTDMGILLTTMSMDEINVLVQNEKALDREIVTQEAKLTTKYKHFHINQSNLLGYFMATGDARDVVMMNAHNIAHMYETDYVGRLTEAETMEVENVVDVLASLYAMKYTRTSHKIRLKKLFKAEMARDDGGNGLELIMKMHTQLQKESKERLFSESPQLFMKGYTSEIYNPYKDVIAATAEEGLELIKQGWKRGDPVVNDTDAVDQEQRYLFTLRDGGQSRRVSGAVSTTGMKARGTAMHDGDLDDRSEIGNMNRKRMDKVSHKKRQALRNMFKAQPNLNPAEHNKGKQFLVAVFNDQGKIANWRYMMKQSTKDRVLDRDNRFDQILGVMAGSIYDKQETKVQNRKVIEALKQQYDLEYGIKPRSYVSIGPMSGNEELREIYNLLPQDTKDAIRELFGKDEMMVRVDILDLTFGYRKLSWADGFKKSRLERDLVDTMMITSMEYVFGRKAPLRVRQGQLWWQTAVQMTKDNMVVKSFSTLAGNFKSNVTELLWFGVNPADIIKHHRVAFRGALDYRRDSAELFELEEKLELDYMVGDARKEMQARAIRLKDAINRNPIKKMIDAGLMPTIVEDIDMQEDIHSYKTRFVRATEKVTKHLNPQLVTAGKWVLMTQDTPLYKLMSHGTQLSDFVARYTLFQHLTTRKVERMEEAAAVQMVSEAFVNYDTPSHRRMQALNDDGFLWFTKYYIRIQRVILMLMRDNPGKTLGMVGLESYFATLPTLLDSAAASRIGNNPLSIGALKLPYTYDDTMIIKALMTPIK